MDESVVSHDHCLYNAALLVWVEMWKSQQHMPSYELVQYRVLAK